MFIQAMILVICEEIAICPEAVRECIGDEKELDTIFCAQRRRGESLSMYEHVARRLESSAIRQGNEENLRFLF